MKEKRTKKEQDEKIKELTEKLHEGIQELYDSDKYRDYLRTMAKFTNYSFNNTILIWAQRPDASAVAGFRAWQTKFDRSVNPGAKGIMIYEPTNYKRILKEKVLDQDGNPIIDQDGNILTREVEKTMPSFKVGYVFAYEDTSGKPLPSIVSILDQEVDGYDTLMNALQVVCPAPIRFAPIPGTANGYYDLEKREICVDSSLPQLQKVKTSIHEIAHGVLHDKVTGEDPLATQREMEVSAESVAFVVCSYLGLDTSDYSFGYVGGWSSGSGMELKELQQKMEVIRKAANTIITGIEAEIMKNTINETQEQKPMIPEVTVVMVQQDKPQHTISHRWR